MRKIFRWGDEHPDHQLARILAGPQLGPLHRPVREQRFHLMVKDPRDLVHSPSTAHDRLKVPAASAWTVRHRLGQGWDFGFAWSNL